jgi:hypothetical protein
MIGSNYRNLVDGKKPTKALGVSRALQKYGSGHATTRANDNGLDFGVYQPITTYPFSILVVTDSASEGVITHLFSQRVGSSPYAQINFLLNARGDYAQQSGTLGLFTQDTTGTRNSPVTGASSVVTSGVHHYGVTDDGSNQRFYVDGFLVATIATLNGNSCFHTSQKLGIGRAADITSNSETNARSQIITRVWNGRSLSAVDFKAQFDNPWGIYKSRRRIFAVGTASGGADLAGSAAAQASASGTISVQVPIVGAATVVATASGTLTTQSPLAGSATLKPFSLFI